MSCRKRRVRGAVSGGMRIVGTAAMDDRSCWGQPAGIESDGVRNELHTRRRPPLVDFYARTNNKCYRRYSGGRCVHLFSLAANFGVLHLAGTPEFAWVLRLPIVLKRDINRIRDLPGPLVLVQDPGFCECEVIGPCGNDPSPASPSDLRSDQPRTAEATGEWVWYKPRKTPSRAASFVRFEFAFAAHSE